MLHPVPALLLGLIALAALSVGAGPAPAQPAPRPGGLSDAGGPAQAALEHARARRADLGLRGAAADFEVLKIRETRGKRYVRLRQTHAGIPVFAAQVVVRVDEAGRTDVIAADLATRADLDLLGNAPSVTADEAAAAAVAWVSERRPAGSFEARPALLEIYAPEVLDQEGPPRLVWVIELGDRAGPGASYRLLIDARDGSVARAFPLSYSALERRIYDCGNAQNINVFLARAEGDPPHPVYDVNLSYGNVGDVYAWYALQHGRDGIDGQGDAQRSNVRYCDLSYPCPFSNAIWDGYFRAMLFGEGWAVDDVTGHEYTHGVTENESGLIYANASGAINESLSDIFGEIVDLTNGTGLDHPSGRWLIGEELPLFTLRSMSDPPAYAQPDRLHSPLYFPPVANPNEQNDQGGVHTNSGVGNKLCSLLADGGFFNGQTVTAMGLYAVAALFYEVNAAILTPASGWADLFHGLRLAAIDLGWSAADRANLDRACLAVEIAIYHVDGSVACANPTGHPVCATGRGPFYTVGGAMASAPAGATISITPGSYPETPLLNKAARLEVYGTGTVRIGP